MNREQNYEPMPVKVTNSSIYIKITNEEQLLLSLFLSLLFELLFYNYWLTVLNNQKRGSRTFILHRIQILVLEKASLFNYEAFNWLDLFTNFLDKLEVL